MWVRWASLSWAFFHEALPVLARTAANANLRAIRQFRNNNGAWCTVCHEERNEFESLGVAEVSLVLGPASRRLAKLFNEGTVGIHRWRFAFILLAKQTYFKTK